MRTFVGFGFGPIQSALFVQEAIDSRQFGRIVIAEVDAAVVKAVRGANGFFSINTAHADRLVPRVLGPVEIYNPTVARDRIKLLEAIAEADELATALPSVSFYAKGAGASVARLLREGFKSKPKPRLVFTAENDTRAAEQLESAVKLSCGACFLNTVIGKMSGWVELKGRSKKDVLEPFTRRFPRAVRVEAFNRILYSRISIPGFRTGFRAFIEKTDLGPFEDAKLYGHNAVHALMGFLARDLGCVYLSDIPESLRNFARAAFVEECGAGLLHLHAGKDPLFTADGFVRYADDLIVRMTNPWLQDRVDRVTRDPRRKLGWNDRLIGAMRRAMDAGVTPQRLAIGAGRAFESLKPAERRRGWASLWPEIDRPRGRKGALVRLLSTVTGGNKR